MKLEIYTMRGIEGPNNSVIADVQLWIDFHRTIEGFHGYYQFEKADRTERGSTIVIAKQERKTAFVSILIHELIHFSVAAVFGRWQCYKKVQDKVEFCMNRIEGLCKTIRGYNWK